MDKEMRTVLEALKNGEMTVDEAEKALSEEKYVDLGYAKVDLDRKRRQKASEVIYGAGKTPEEIIGILTAMKARGQETVLVTRLSEEAAAVVGESCPIRYNARAHLALMGEIPQPSGLGTIVVATGGTSDIPVAEEAAYTAEVMGNKVERLYDVGVAGIHRLLSHKNDLENASVIIAVAGMEGALASVVGGLVSCPVIAVPTSVGYGASFGGLSALLAMLNSCASGTAVVNIDNGFGAGFLASRINHMEVRP